MRFSSSLRPLLPLALLSSFAFAQLPAAHPGALAVDAHQYFASSTSPSGPLSFRTLATDIWLDQKTIWNGPLHLKKSDLQWLLPLAATTGALIATDRHVMTLIHSNSQNRSRSSLVSDSGVAVFGIAAVASFGLGKMAHNNHAAETGALMAEAFAGSYLVAEAFKIVSARQRPDTASAQGLFDHASPLNSSFPSQHAALAWAAAAVLAREYPGPAMQWSAYGLASLVSLSRVTATKHFPSDILIGAATGYLLGRFVYRKHHDDRMTDFTGSTPVGPRALIRSPIRRLWSAKSSSYVTLDSWIYPALKRLAVLGYVPDQVSGLGPWTRAECLRQTEEAADIASTRGFKLRHAALNGHALALIAELQAELAAETSSTTTFRLESIYTRATGIRGSPLRDSYHFGQTIANDFGRPYDKGFSNVTGFSMSASTGPLFVYLRAEYQTASGRPADPLAVRQFIATTDGNPLLGPVPTAATHRFEPLEMYAGVKIGFENITFGKQSLWWGPDENSAFSFSNNAEPFYMLRVAQSEPLVLPGFLSHLGKIRTEFILGKLSGHHWPARPYVNAQKVSLDLTDNFEVGFTRSAFFGGVGHPLTFGSFEASLVSTVSKDYGPYGNPNNPGDRHSGFDFHYRVPGLRRYVTVYSDSYADDDPNPIDNPRRAAWAPGVYLAQIPKLRKLDFRFETYSTWLYQQDYGGSFIYWNNQYRDSYTNNGSLLGSWVGRDSRAYQASTTYWVSAKSKLQAQYRQIKAGNNFLPGGGTQTDVSVKIQWALTPEWLVAASAQYERYFVPALGGPQRNLLGSLQIVFTPRNWGR